MNDRTRGIFKKYRIELISLFLIIVLDVGFVLAMIYLVAIYLALPIAIIILLHYTKLWQTKRRLVIGTIGIVIGALLTVAILTPVITAQYKQALATPPFYTNDSKNITSLTVIPYYSPNAKNFTFMFVSKNNIPAKFTILKKDSLNAKPTSLYNYTVNYTVKRNNSYVYYLNISNLPKTLIECKVSQNHSYALILGPILIQKSALDSMISNIAFVDAKTTATLGFIMAEVFYVLIIFGVSVLRRGRAGLRLR